MITNNVNTNINLNVAAAAAAPTQEENSNDHHIVNMPEQQQQMTSKNTSTSFNNNNNHHQPQHHHHHLHAIQQPQDQQHGSSSSSNNSYLQHTTVIVGGATNDRNIGWSESRLSDVVRGGSGGGSGDSGVISNGKNKLRKDLNQQHKQNVNMLQCASSGGGIYQQHRSNTVNVSPILNTPSLPSTNLVSTANMIINKVTAQGPLVDNNNPNNNEAKRDHNNKLLTNKPTNLNNNNNNNNSVTVIKCLTQINYNQKSVNKMNTNTEVNNTNNSTVKNGMAGCINMTNISINDRTNNSKTEEIMFVVNNNATVISNANNNNIGGHKIYNLAHDEISNSNNNSNNNKNNINYKSIVSSTANNGAVQKMMGSPSGIGGSLTMCSVATMTTNLAECHLNNHKKPPTIAAIITKKDTPKEAVKRKNASTSTSPASIEYSLNDMLSSSSSSVSSSASSSSSSPLPVSTVIATTSHTQSTATGILVTPSAMNNNNVQQGSMASNMAGVQASRLSYAQVAQRKDDTSNITVALLPTITMNKYDVISNNSSKNESIMTTILAPAGTGAAVLSNPSSIEKSSIVSSTMNSKAVNAGATTAVATITAVPSTSSGANYSNVNIITVRTDQSKGKG